MGVISPFFLPAGNFTVKFPGFWAILLEGGGMSGHSQHISGRIDRPLSH